jgi:hypothetical protein
MTTKHAHNMPLVDELPKLKNQQQQQQQQQHTHKNHYSQNTHPKGVPKQIVKSIDLIAICIAMKIHPCLLE